MAHRVRDQQRAKNDTATGPQSTDRDAKNKASRGKIVIPVDTSRSLPRFSSDNAPQKPQAAEIYGTISTVKQGFGFLQPILEEDQIYFGGRELAADMKVGDRVGFVTRESARGLAAENVRLLSGQTETVATQARGTLSRSPDRHRSNFGLITVEVSGLDPRSAGALEAAGVKEVAFLPIEVAGSTVPKGHRLDKGDYVEFAVHRVLGSNLFLARAVKLIALKRDRAVALQIQRMLDAGVQREQGVVSTLKRGEYGFIKPLDRKEDVYFRIGDSGAAGARPSGGGAGDSGDAEGDPASKLNEGDEVAFFVITECVKGKMSDRAIHVTPLPKGTVRFEVVVASGVSAVVTAECGARTEESPGLARLLTEVTLAGKEAADPSLAAAAAAARAKRGDRADSAAAVSSIELWQRCLPEDLVCKVGDQLSLDVHFYRPEKLFFARSVRVLRFRPLGRERGTVCAVKENGFGFIHSALRSADVYFKLSHVIGESGAVRVGAPVSFEVVCEEGGGHGSGKLRAKRVQVEEGAPSALEDSGRYLIQAGLTGVVVRTSSKKDSAGMIKVLAGREQLAVPYYDPDLLTALEDFAACADLQSVTLQALPLSVVRTYSRAIEDRFRGSVAHECKPASGTDANLGYNLRVFKLSGEGYEQWLAAQSGSADSSGAAKARKRGVDAEGAESTTVPFFKDDYCSPEFGPLTNDLRVTFSVCWDPVRGKRVARNIRLTDEAVLDASGSELGEQRGVIDVLVDKGEKYGFIRCIPSDEKLFWHRSSTLAEEQGGAVAPLMLGSEVAFQLRRRGGLRCAADIRTLPAGTLSTEHTLTGTCSALVVSVTPPRLVILDASGTPELARKYVDLRVIGEVNGARVGGRSPIPEQQWAKISLEDANSPEPASTPVIDGGDEDVRTEAVEDGDGADAGLQGLQEHNRAEGFGAKYFPPLPRTAIPFTSAATVTAVQAGDVVTCTVTVQWALQRHPVSAEVTAVESSAAAQRRRGRIVRPKFRVKAPTVSAYVDSEALSSYALGTTDLCELLDPGSEAGPLFCFSNELQPADESSRDLPQAGDEVEMWVLTGRFAGALLPKLLPRSSARDATIMFSKRPGLVSGAQAGGSASAGGEKGGVKAAAAAVIVMAEGPPSDAALGFAQGWRTAGEGEAVAVASLPWAHLLTHLAHG